MRILFLTLIFIFYSNISNAVEFNGKFAQGSFIIGKVEKGSKIEIDKRKIRLTEDGYFAFGLDRDRKNDVVIKIRKNGNTEIIEKKVFRLIFSFKNKYPNIANQIVWVLIINKTFATVVCVIETI